MSDRSIYRDRILAAPVQRLAVDHAAGGPTEWIAAPGEGRKVIVLGLFLAGGTGAGTVVFLSAAVALTGAMTLTKDTSWSAACSECGILECATNKALNVTTATVTLAGSINYVVIDA